MHSNQVQTKLFILLGYDLRIHGFYTLPNSELNGNYKKNQLKLKCFLDFLK